MPANNSSAEISVLMDIVELAKRCGLSPSDADATINFEPDRGTSKNYRLLFVWGVDTSDPDMARFQQLMGVPDGGEEIYAATIRDLAERVEHALSLAPRARVR